MPDQPELYCVAGLEIAVFGREQNPGAPVVFVTHGRGGQLAGTFAGGADLAANGFIAVGVEQRNHGRRIIDARANQGFGRATAADMYGIIVGTATDVATLMDFLPARLGISTERCGMTGGSLGGHATLMATCMDGRIRAASALIGGGDFRRLMELRAESNGCPKPGETFADYFPAGLEDAVRKRDPIRHPERFADRALLMANAEDDPIVQIECARRLHSALLPHYTRPERLKLSEYANTGHNVPPAMWAEAVAWLRRWLIETPV